MRLMRDFLAIGLILLGVGILYMMTLGKFLLPKHAKENLEKDYKQYFLDFGEQSSTADAMREYASLLALYLNRAKEAISILEKIVAITL